MQMNWSNEWQNSPEWIEKINQEAEQFIASYKEVTLSIPQDDNWPLQIKAQQIGDLAVHEPIPDVEGIWRRITHVPTLTMFDMALPDNCDGMNLLWWIAEVQKGELDAWNVLRELTPETYQDRSDRVMKAKDAIFNHCQSIRSE